MPRVDTFMAGRENMRAHTCAVRLERFGFWPREENFGVFWGVFGRARKMLECCVVFLSVPGRLWRVLRGEFFRVNGFFLGFGDMSGAVQAQSQLRVWGASNVGGCGRRRALARFEAARRRRPVPLLPHRRR